MSDNSATKIKDIVSLYLDKLKDEEFRFNLFFKLNDKQYFLFNIFQPKKGFLPEYKGLQLSATKNFIDTLKNNDEYESFGEIVSNHPFLYGNFLKDSTLYIKNIYAYSYNVGLFEFVIKRDLIEPHMKQLLNDLIEAAMPYFIDVFMQIRQDILRRNFSINALNIIKNARPRTFYHSFRVADLSIAIAQKMGLDKKSQRRLCYAAIIHDIGEMYIPHEVFYKEDTLTDEEFEMIKQHPKNLKNMFSHNLAMDDITSIVYYHHERMDGKGYYGHKKDEIPIESRILALSETVDGLYTDRPGRKGFDVKQIVEVVKNSAIDVFDEDVSKNAIEIINRFYANREIDVSMLNNINNVGKPVTIVVSKNTKLMLLQGAIEYISNKIMGVTFNNSIDVRFSFNDIVRLQFPFFDIIYDFKASVISSSDVYVNLMIKGPSESVLSNLNVFWEFDAIVVPLKLQGKILNSNKSNMRFVKIKTKRFGSKSLSAMISETLIKLNIGDTVVLKMKPLSDMITIPAIISNIIDEGGHTLAYFEYFNLSESADARIHQAIYYKQSQQNVF